MNREKEYWIQATVNSCFFQEWVDANTLPESSNVNCDIVLECAISAVKEGHEFPFEEIRVTLREHKEKFLEQKPESIEIGFLREDNEFLLWVRPELIQNVCSSFNLVKSRGMEIFIKLPYCENEKPDFLKLLQYQIRIRT